MTDQSEKRPVRRPVGRPLREAIPDSLENIMRAILATPPKDEDEWKYLAEEAG